MCHRFLQLDPCEGESHKKIIFETQKKKNKKREKNVPKIFHNVKTKTKKTHAMILK